MRENTLTSGVPARARGQGRGVGPGHEGPGHGGHVPDPDQGNLGGVLDLEDLAPGRTERLL